MNLSELRIVASRIARRCVLRAAVPVALAIGLTSPPAPAQAEAGHDHAAHAASGRPAQVDAGVVERRALRRTAPWPDEVVRTFATLPVQDGGRVKPLSTYADFQLLKANGRRKFKVEGETHSSTEWLLDVLFFPEQAREYEVFRIADNAVLTAMGLSIPNKKKSDRYSFDQLQPGIPRLFELARMHSRKEAKDQTAFERLILQLAGNLSDYSTLDRWLDFAREDFDLRATEGLRTVFTDPENASRFSTVLERAPMLRLLFSGLPSEDQATPAALTERREADRLLSELGAQSSLGERGLAVVPPALPVAERKEWSTPHELIGEALTVQRELAREIALVRGWEEMEFAKTSPEAFSAALARVARSTSELADARGEWWRIPLEVDFYRVDFFTRALVFFLIGFLLIAISWLSPSLRWPVIGTWLSVFVGSGFLITGIVMRCILRGRPPVSTLYETILFISAVCILVALFIEYLNRERIALAVSALIGTLGMFLSMKYELKEAVTAGDTMPSLVAVLDTNFWLSTHVTTVTMGYSAGLLASALAHVWLVGKFLGLKRDDEEFYRSVTRMVYGVLCFGLLFSIVGTILGGIWANYSWGRFWGWDPKENGSLLIVLWFLLILHARMGGLVKAFGLHALTVIGGMVVAFSWWGVNLLGVGLHSYGFTSGVALVLWTFYLLEAGVVGASLIWRFLQRKEASAVAASGEGMGSGASA